MTTKTLRVRFAVLFVVSSTLAMFAGPAYASGTWTNATEIPGFSTLDVGHASQSEAISCSSNGNCSAGGEYYDEANKFQAFLDTQANGTWGDAVEVPGLAAMNLGGDASIFAISCSSDGNRSAGGKYAPIEGSDSSSLFVCDLSGHRGRLNP
jgi:hypothetical protein